MDTLPEARPLGTSHPLHQTAEKYREEAKAKFMDVPVRAVLLHTLFQALLDQQQYRETADTQGQGMAQLGRQLELPEVGWGAAVIDESRQPMNHQDLIGKVGQFSEIVLSKDVIHRFNATHSLSPAKTGTSTFLLEVGLRASGVETAWAILEMISGLSALQVIGLQIRREGLRRGGLANEVQKLMCLYRLVLHNPSNQCYLNAFAYMYLWCHCRLEAPEYQLFGTNFQAWRDVLLHSSKATYHQQVAILAKPVERMEATCFPARCCRFHDACYPYSGSAASASHLGGSMGN